jgi:hypothetical protein
MKSLISGQKILVDNHNPGFPVDGLEGVHIHKKMLDGKNKGKEIEINITTGQIKPKGENWNINEFERIKNEIRKVLDNDKQKLIELAKKCAKIMWEYSNHKVTIKEAQYYAQNIAKAFGLKPEIEKEIILRVGETIKKYISLHRDEKGISFFILQGATNITISEGNFYIYTKFNKYRYFDYL